MNTRGRWLLFCLCFFCTIQGDFRSNALAKSITEKPCRDENDHCEDWAKTGECDSNPEYMNESCRAACNICEPVPDYTSQFVNYVEKATNGGTMGVPQALHFFDGTLPQDIYWVLSKAQNYLDNIVVPTYGTSLLEICQNYDDQCAYWSLIGECESNPKFMSKTCAPVCQTCHEMTLEYRCPLDPDEPDGWQPGDLNAMFTRLTSEPYLSQYSVQTISSPSMGEGGGPWIIQLDDVLTADEAAQMIELGHMMKYERSTDVGERKPDGSHDKKVSEGRTSTNAWCVDVCEEDEVAMRLGARLSDLVGLPETNAESLQLLRYEESQFYDIHHDYIWHHRDKRGGPRILTVFMYLNDVQEGGGTNFDQLNITIAPKRGRVVIWPSVLDEEPLDIDYRTSHQALPVLKGIKYGANAWFHLRDFKTANKQGCMG